MPAKLFANAVKEFEVVLDDLESSFEFVRSASRLRPRLGVLLDWQHMSQEERQLVQSFVGQRSAEESVLFRGMLVSIAGALEQFVGRVLLESVVAINQAFAQYDKLDDRLKKENLFRTGVALRTVHEPPGHLKFDYKTLAKNVGTCFTGSTVVKLNAEAFLAFISIVSPEKIGEALSRVGVKLNWDDLAKAGEIRAVLVRSDTRETSKALQECLRRFGQTRNKVAHTGSSGVVVVESDLEQYLKFFRAFGRVFSSAVEGQILKCIPK